MPRQGIVSPGGTKLENFQSGIVCPDKALWAQTGQNLKISNPELCARTRSCGPRRAILCFATWLRATPTHELQKGLHGLAACGVQFFAKFLAELLQHLLALTANLMGLKDNRTRKFNEETYLLDTRFLRFGLFVASSLWKGVSPVFTWPTFTFT